MEILGYAFRDAKLLETALTTPACKMECPDAQDNQRLEFLGDAVLGLLSARSVYAAYPEAQEGQLSVRRTHMVSATALCAAAVRAGLVAHLRRNHGASPLPENSKTIADAVEAILGAAYLDGGMAAAERIYETLGIVANAGEDVWSGNAKGYLQERVQAMRPPRRPEYEVLKTSGRAHEPVFTVRVSVEGVGEATAEAHSRREAEAEAAARLVAFMKNGERSHERGVGCRS